MFNKTLAVFVRLLDTMGFVKLLLSCSEYKTSYIQENSCLHYFTGNVFAKNGVRFVLHLN